MFLASTLLLTSAADESRYIKPFFTTFLLLVGLVLLFFVEFATRWNNLPVLWGKLLDSPWDQEVGGAGGRAGERVGGEPGSCGSRTKAERWTGKK